MNALLSQAADLRAQAHTLAEQALFGDLFASTSTETIAQLNAQADALEAQAAAAPASKVTFEKSAQGATSNEAHSEIWLNGERVGRLTTLKWGGVALTYTVEIFSVNYRNPQPFHVEDYTHARAALAAARRYATDLLTAPAPAVNDDVEVEPSHAEQLDAIFEELLSPVSEPVAVIPAHDDDELLSQWRDANRAGEGRAFGDPDDLTCEADVYEAAELEGARVVCALDAPDCYLVSWSDDYYVVCDCNGWWACRVSL